MPVRRSPNGARHVRPQLGRNRPEGWSRSIGTPGRNQLEQVVAITRCAHARPPLQFVPLRSNANPDEVSTTGAYRHSIGRIIVVTWRSAGSYLGSAGPAYAAFGHPA